MTVPGNLSSPLLAVSAAAAAAGGGITKSVRFNRADSPYLNRTPSSAGNTRTWTWSGWVKFSTDPNDLGLFTGYSASSLTMIRFKSHLLDFVVEGVTHRRTAAFFRDPSAWYHIVWAFDSTQSTASNRSRLYINGVEITDFSTNNTITQNQTTGVNSTNAQVIGATSTTPDDEFDGYMTDVYLIDGQQLDCTSFGAFDDSGVWQAAAYSGTYPDNSFHLFDFANESTVGHDSSGNNNDFTANNISAVTTNGSYTGGISVGNFTLTGYDKNDVVDGDLSGSFYADRPINNNGLNFSSIPQASTSVRIRAQLESGTLTTNGGDIATGSTNNQWLTVSTTYPFTLTYIRASGGNASDGFFIYGIEVDGTVLVDNRFGAGDDVMRDVPVNGDSSDDTGAGGEVSGNYCTLNPLKKSSEITLTNGNLDLSTSSTSNKCKVFGTIGVSSGKWYYEVTIGTNHRGAVGWATSQDSSLAGQPGDNTGDYAFTFDGSKIYQDSYTSGYGSAFSTGMVIGVRVDATAGTIGFSQNGTDLGDAFTGQTGKTFWPIVGDASSGGTFDGSVNFGQRAFAFTAPSNYKALCTSNLPTPTIADGSAHFESKLYTGNGSTNALTMSNSSMSPDIVWIHERSTTGDYELFDSVRGANKVVETNSKNPQSTVANTLTSFDSNGFTLGSSSLVNDNNVTYVGWSWESGSSNASNTTGSINSTCRTNIAAGISIVTYTGSGSAATVGHSLGVVPEFIIIKNLDASKNHIVYHAHMHSSPAEKAMNLNETTEIYDSAGTFNDTAPTSTVFSVGTGAATNSSGEGHRALCFAPVSGFSAMGKYNGTGNSDTGAFNYTGMRPAWVMIKRITNQESWVIYDTSRNTHNSTVSRLYADLSNAESDNTSHFIDILSNGFRVRSGGGLLGASGNEYLYVAFAENPFQANGGLAR